MRNQIQKYPRQLTSPNGGQIINFLAPLISIQKKLGIIIKKCFKQTREITLNSLVFLGENIEGMSKGAQ